jgi:hypothetical protein
MPLFYVVQETPNTWSCACIYIFFIYFHPTFLSVMWCVVGVQSNRHHCVKHWIKNSYMEKFLVILNSDMSAICFTSVECSGSQKVIIWSGIWMSFCFAFWFCDGEWLFRHVKIGFLVHYKYVLWTKEIFSFTQLFSPVLPTYRTGHGMCKLERFQVSTVM